MNKVNFVASGIIDQEESGDIVIYSELFAGDRGNTTQGTVSEKVILRGKGVTINQAFYDMQSSSTFPMAYDVMKATMFTERFAKKGLKDHLDTMVRNQKPTIKQFLFILEEDPVEFYSIHLRDERFIGIFLEDMMVMQGNQESILPVRFNQFYNERIQSGKVAFLPTISLCDEPQEKRIVTTGLAILRNDKMVGKLDSMEVSFYKLMTNQIKQGNITIQNPEDSGHYISLLVSKSKAEEDIEYDGEKAILKIKIDTIASVLGIEGETKLMDGDKEIIHAANKRLKEKSEELFYKFQEQDIDLFHIESKFHRKYPHVDSNNILENAEIELDVHVEIESSQNITDFQQ